MAEIETSVLRIGSNDLVLQDSAARGSLAAAYSASSTYAVGDMVLKDGQLYECNTAISTAEAWTAAHWTAVTVGDEITSLKNDLTAVEDDVADLNDVLLGGYIDVDATFTNGGYISASNGNLIEYAHWKYTDYIDVSDTENNTIYAYTTAPDNRYYNAFYDQNKAFISSFTVSNSELAIPTNAKYVRMSIQEAYNCGVRIYKKGGIKEELYNTLVTDTASGAIASFPDGANNVPVKSLKVNIEPVQSGSGDPSPDNVRSISGHTQVVVTRTGKNLFEVAQNNKWLNGSGVIIDDLDSAVSQKISLTSGIMLTLSTAEAGNALAMCFYDASGTLLQRTAQGNVKSITTISPLGTSYMYAGRYKKAGGENVQLEFGSTASTYEPYHGQTVTISLNGTRYGGTLDVTTGVLTVDMAFIASYNGETLPSTWISDRDVYAAGTTPTTGAQVCYKLATPQTVQLTAQEIRTLLGQNNVFADCGDTTVEYRADTNINIVKNKTDIIELNKEMEPFVQSLPTGYPENAKTYFSATHDPLSFAHFSDIHNVPELWKRIAEYVDEYSTYLPFALHTGDYVGDNQTSYTDLYAFYMPSVPFYNCVGNHDTYANGQHTTATKQSVYEKLFNHISNWNVTFMSGNYSMSYYKDFADSNIRLIVFDNYYDIATQKTWLANILEDARTNGLHVITASHQVTGRPQNKVNCTFETLIPYESAGSGSLLNTEFDAVIGDFINNGGKHIVHLCGHEHIDSFYKTTNGVLNYAIECATDYTGWTEGARVPYTKSWDCFNAISADVDLGILKIVRIGHNVDCFNRAKNILSYDYINGTLLNNE